MSQQEIDDRIHPRCRGPWLKAATAFVDNRFDWLTSEETNLQPAQIKGLEEVGILQRADDRIGLTDYGRKVFYK